MSDAILVTGATGTQGGAVVRHLLKRGACVRALTRDTTTERAKALKEAGCELVAGDLRDPASLNQAFAGVCAVFSVQDFYAPGVGHDGEIDQGRNLAEAAKRAGIDHFVQSTMMQTGDPGDVEHFRSKFQIERIIEELRLPHTFVGTTWFMDNVTNPKTGGPMTFPALAGTLKRDTAFHTLAIDDFGEAVATILLDPQTHIGKRYDLTSEVTTVRRMKDDYKRVTGRRAKWWAMPNIMLRFFAPEFAAQLRWHVSKGWTQGPSQLRVLLDREPTSFEGHLRTVPNVVL